MKKKLLLLALICQLGLYAQNNLFSPSSNISPFGSVSSPITENFPKIIDGNINTKFLDFNYTDGIGFTVNLNGVGATAYQMKITTANDFPQRDPQNYQILGSNNGTNFTAIASGSIVCNATRFFESTYNFANSVSYSYYRLIFTNQCNTSESMFQIAEVQLIHNALGIAQFNQTESFTLFPNPSNGTFSIRSRNSSTIDVITVTDLVGKQIAKVKLNATTNAELKLDGISSGIYFVQITSGNESLVKRIVIQ